MENRALTAIEDRLVEINKVIEKLDPSIRAKAFDLIVAQLDGFSRSGSGPEAATGTPGNRIDLPTLMETHKHDKPSDNVHLLVADWYQNHGSVPFTLEHLKQAAGRAGLTIPERPDMTLKQAQDEGKKLYTSPGHGLYKLTVNGELYIRKTYGVPKGTEAATATAS